MGSTPIPLVEISGSPRELGESLGEEMSQAIRHLADTRLDLLRRSFDLSGNRDIRHVAEQMAAAIEERSSDLSTETRAVATAAGLEYWQLVVAGGYSDVADVLSRRLSKEGSNNWQECTLTSTPSCMGQLIVGTWDSHGSAVPALALCRRKPTRWPATLALTTAGWPMQQGVTSNGIAFAIANLVARRVSAGLPYIAVLPLVAAQATLRLAADMIFQTAHASARYYLLCDPHMAVSIEVAPDDATEVRSFESVGHTNHFTGPHAAVYEGRSSKLGSSRTRLEEASAYIARTPSEQDIPSRVRSFAAMSVIQRGSGDEDATGVVFAIDPTSRSIYYLLPEPEVDCENLPLHHVTMECEG